MILMPQIFDVIANENARYKRNELECDLSFSETPYKKGGAVSVLGRAR